MNLNERSIKIKQIATAMGFDFCGIAKARHLDEDAIRLEQWLNKGFQGKMHYMENHFDLRINPTRLVPGAKSVITLLFNYYPAAHQNDNAPSISKYAYGEDYHEVIRDRLKEFLQTLKSKFGDFAGRGFVDSAPVLERSWAVQSGLGWIGKNGNLIHKKAGSFFFIASLIVDLELEYDIPTTTNHCGTCTRCIDSCPTEAILPNQVVDGSKCISYFTIELKDNLIPDNMKGKFQQWMFGCDVCQDVCPWNRFSHPHHEPRLQPVHEILNFSLHDWLDMTEETFRKTFAKSPLKRSKYSGIRRNLQFINPNNHE